MRPAAWEGRAWQKPPQPPSAYPPRQSRTAQPRTAQRRDSSSPCKRARVLQAKVLQQEVQRPESFEPAAPRAKASGPLEASKTLPASGPAADCAARLLQQMLAALTPEDPDPRAHRPRPAGAPPCAGDGGSCGAARRSAALERLVHARRPSRPISPSAGSGSGSDSPPGRQHSAAGRGKGAPGAYVSLGCGRAHARGRREGASMLLFVEGCVPTQRNCTVSLHAQGPHEPWEELAPWDAAADGVPGRVLHSERTLPELQAGLQRAASPAIAAFLDVWDLGWDPHPAAGYAEAHANTDQTASQASWHVQGAPGRAGGSGAAAEAAAADAREHHAAVAQAVHTQRRASAHGVSKQPASGRQPERSAQHAGSDGVGLDRDPQLLRRRVRARVHPSTRPGASWGSINAVHIAPVRPRRLSPSNPRATRPAWQVAGSASGAAGPGPAQQRPSIGQAVCGASAGREQDGRGSRAGSEGSEKRVRVEPAPADVAGLLQALRGVEALALAVREDTHASRQVMPGIACAITCSEQSTWTDMRRTR